MTVRVVVDASVRDGRLEDAAALMAGMNARIVAMGGPPGDVFFESVGGSVGSMLHLYWDFATFAAWGTWEDASNTDTEFQALFAQALDPGGPFVLPFARSVYNTL
jgi:hypothetical protein